jgi:hypothetical protein
VFVERVPLGQRVAPARPAVDQAWVDSVAEAVCQVRRPRGVDPPAAEPGSANGRVATALQELSRRQGGGLVEQRLDEGSRGALDVLDSRRDVRVLIPGKALAHR